VAVVAGRQGGGDITASAACRECGSSPTCNAHIIPKGFARLIRETNNRVLEISARGAFPAKRQNGFSDRNILCASCDGIIGVLDDWAISYCRSFDLPKSPTPYELVRLRGLNQEDACRFAVSVFWRASISEIPQFSDINLGPYETVARDIVFGRSSGLECEPLHLQINVLVSSHADMKSHISLPLQVRGSTGPYLIFAVGGLQWLVRFGSTPFGIGKDRKIAADLAVNKSLKALAIACPFNESADFDLYLQSMAARRRP
jgi:hypothetical protein